MRRGFILILISLLVPIGVSSQVVGPGTSQTPFVVPVASHVTLQSIVSAGDSVPGDTGAYRMAGKPDGLGAWDNGDGTFTLLMNHEFGIVEGIPRDHGRRGAFVSKWVIDKSTREVLSGEDLIQTVALWDIAAGQYIYDTATLCRFCSADLPAEKAFHDSTSGKGTLNRIFTNGEECGREGRAFAHVATGPDAGISFELPRAGNASFENLLASPYPQELTLLIGLEDDTGGQIYVYVGAKRAQGLDIELAGLANGSLFGLVVDGVPVEDRVTGIGDTIQTFSLYGFGDVSGLSGLDLENQSDQAGVTQFLRPEDGHWDPENPGVFYFVTTDRFDQTKDGVGSQIGRTRLWRLRFADITDPVAGGVIEVLLDGTEPGTNMLDNITIDHVGNVIIQEDPGGAERAAKIWNYDIAADQLTEIARADPDRFGDSGVDPTPPFNSDEESSGVIDVSNILGSGWFLLTLQAHYNIGDVELDEDGQLMALYSHASAPERMTLDAPVPGVAGQDNTIHLAGAVPENRIFFVYGMQFGSAGVPGCDSMTLEIYDPRIAGSIPANLTGEADLVIGVPIGASGRTILIQAVDPTGCAISNPIAYAFQ